MARSVRRGRLTVDPSGRRGGALAQESAASRAPRLTRKRDCGSGGDIRPVRSPPFWRNRGVANDTTGLFGGDCITRSPPAAHAARRQSLSGPHQPCFASVSRPLHCRKIGGDSRIPRPCSRQRTTQRRGRSWLSRRPVTARGRPRRLRKRRAMAAPC